MIIRTVAGRAPWRARLANFFDRAESLYLRILRAMVLVVATAMIAVATWLVLSGFYKVSRSPDSVQEQVTTVSANDILGAEMPPTQVTGDLSKGEPTATPPQRQFYNDFVNRYYDLFRKRFEPFRQGEDKVITRDEFDDSFIGSERRLKQVASGELDFYGDRNDLKSLLAVMTQVAEQPETQQRLDMYRKAIKVPVANKVERTRTEYRRGWDSSSTNCEGWYYSPVGCAAQRAVEVPYVETVTSMEFPKGTQSHTQIFQALQNRYFELLGERRETNANAARDERQAIVIGKVEGAASFMTALQLCGAFLALMFFFLLIAIERHQRRMSAMLSDAAVD